MNTFPKLALVLALLGLVPIGTVQADGLFKTKHLQTHGQKLCDVYDQSAACPEAMGKDSELAMIELQSLISQRQQAVQLTTSMLNHLNGDGKGCVICQNIGK